MSQNKGKIFEIDWKNSIPSDTYYLRIVDPAVSWGNNEESNIRFSPKNPYDAIMYCYPNLFTLELKSTKGTSFSFEGTSPMIKSNQIKELTRASQHKGIISGFIFNMRKYNKSWFLYIDDFNRFLENTNKKSINKDDIIEYGGIEVVGEIKRTRCRYYVGEFIERVKVKNGKC